MFHSNVAVHISWEATTRLGGIGTALEHLITSPAYQQLIPRTILLSPFYPASFGLTADPFTILAKEGEVLYSGRHHIDNGCYSSIFRHVETDYDVSILYGRRAFSLLNASNATAEVLLIDLAKAFSRHSWIPFVSRLSTTFPLNAAINRTGTYIDYDYEYGIVLAEPAIAALSALLDNVEHTILLISHQVMGLPSLYKVMLDNNMHFRTVFHLQECPSSRYWIEREDGSDTRFYNMLRHGMAHHKYLDSMLGDMSFHGQHRLLSCAYRCDAVIAIGGYALMELRFLNHEFAAKPIDLCYHGIPAVPVTLSAKLRSRRLLQSYAKRLLGWSPDLLLTHIARPVRCKALWRDVAVCHALNRLLSEHNAYGLLFIVSSAYGSRSHDELERMAAYGWPRYHRCGRPDLQGEEISLANDVDNFNRSHRNMQIILVNSFCWPDRSESSTGMTRWDLRQASDVEFGQSMYEPFGISQLEPLCCGAICVVSSVSGAANALADICQGAYPDNILLADYVRPLENCSVEQLRRWTAVQQKTLESAVAEQLAYELWRRLPRDDVGRHGLLKSGQALARQLSWECVIQRQLWPVIYRLCGL